MLLIADLGNNHFGDFEKAKELIRAAHESGADLIKGQAFNAVDVNGSMPNQFYEDCQFSISQYIDLIYYAKSIGAEMFYSIFSREFDDVRKYQRHFKIAASQSLKYTAEDFKCLDYANMIISVSDTAKLSRDIAPDKLEYANILYATPYLPKENFVNFTKFFRLKDIAVNFGISDHCIGIKNCILAHNHGATIIEKHFTLEKEMHYAEHKFRDTIHGSTPKEFEKLAKAVK